MVCPIIRTWQHCHEMKSGFEKLNQFTVKPNFKACIWNFSRGQDYRESSHLVKDNVFEVSDGVAAVVQH
jgi:hypothetical protein